VLGRQGQAQANSMERRYMPAPGRGQRLDHYDYKGLGIGTTSPHAEGGTYGPSALSLTTTRSSSRIAIEVAHHVPILRYGRPRDASLAAKPRFHTLRRER
jgi:hypothetical protein